MLGYNPPVLNKSLGMVTQLESPPREAATLQRAREERHSQRRCCDPEGRADLQEISRKERHGENWLQFTGVLSRLYSDLGRIVLENGLR